MSDTNLQARTADQPPVQKRASLSEKTGGLQEAVSRAFENAQAVESAVHADSESLEQFMNRAMNKLFECDEGTHLRIGRTGDMESLKFGDLQVHDDAPCKGKEWLKDFDYGPYLSGHPIGLAVWVESEDEYEKVCKLMEDYGFALSFLSKDRSCRFPKSDYRDRSELNSRLLADFACSILRGFWGITAKKEIVCRFDHEKGRFT